MDVPSLPLDVVSCVSGKASIGLLVPPKSVELLLGAGGAEGVGKVDDDADALADDDAAAVWSNDEDILLCHLASMGWILPIIST